MYLTVLDKLLIKIMNDNLYRVITTMYFKGEYAYSDYLLIEAADGERRPWRIQFYKAVGSRDLYKNGNISIYNNFAFASHIYGKLYGAGIEALIEERFIKALANRHSEDTADTFSTFTATIGHYVNASRSLNNGAVDAFTTFGCIKAMAYWTARHYMGYHSFHLGTSEDSEENIEPIIDPNRICSLAIPDKPYVNVFVQTFAAIYECLTDRSKWTVIEFGMD